MSRAEYMRAWRQQAKRKARIPRLLEQPALLTERIQPVRRPILRLKKVVSAAAPLLADEQRGLVAHA